jgi:hypothetical protein
MPAVIPTGPEKGMIESTRRKKLKITLRETRRPMSQIRQKHRHLEHQKSVIGRNHHELTYSQPEIPIPKNVSQNLRLLKEHR